MKFELCKQIRSRVHCPIIFLTAKMQEADIVRGLGLGTDDYITKPFGTAELRARVNAHLRRDTREKKNSFSISGIVFQIRSLVFQNYNLIDHLTPVENVLPGGNADADILLTQMGIDRVTRKRGVMQLSGGQQQRISLISLRIWRMIRKSV